jgi:phosphatidylserine/phosphatidylglycerophosphate/cardiolipin synthase-like enzyme
VPADGVCGKSDEVVDRHRAFVTSANLTARAQGENIELGVLVNLAPTAARIARCFEALIDKQLLVTACSV